MAIEKIMGTETELGISAKDPAGFDPVSSSILLINSHRPLAPVRAIWDYTGENPLLDARGFEVSGERERPSQQDNRTINKLLRNGGRLYVDGAHPEYSTPECTNARDVVCYEKAGERIFELCLASANLTLPERQRIVVYKNNSDGKGNSYGNHENYLMERRGVHPQRCRPGGEARAEGLPGGGAELGLLEDVGEGHHGVELVCAGRRGLVEVEDPRVPGEGVEQGLADLDGERLADGLGRHQPHHHQHLAQADLGLLLRLER